jgi:hypothetical protein
MTFFSSFFSVQRTLTMRRIVMCLSLTVTQLSTSIKIPLVLKRSSVLIYLFGFCFWKSSTEEMHVNCRNVHLVH